MAQDKTTAKSDTEQPRDQDGRFTGKDAGAKSSGTSGSASKSKDSDSKSAGGSKDSSSKSR
jgi:hypothetical protein